MTGEGIVVKLNGNTATVRIKRSSACGHDCGECNLCKNPDIEVDILNPIGAKIGDRVKIGTDTRKVMLSAFVLYMLPIVGAFVLYGVLSSLNISAKIAVVSEIVWFALWFVYVRHFSKHKVTMSCALEIVEG